MSRQLEFEFSYGKKLQKPRTSIDASRWRHRFDDLFAESELKSAQRAENTGGKFKPSVESSQGAVPSI